MFLDQILELVADKKRSFKINTTAWQPRVACIPSTHFLESTIEGEEGQKRRLVRLRRRRLLKSSQNTSMV